MLIILGGKGMADKKIRISLDINAELGKVQSKVSQLQQQLNKVQLTGLSGQALVSDFDNIQNRIKTPRIS